MVILEKTLKSLNSALRGGRLTLSRAMFTALLVSTSGAVRSYVAETSLMSDIACERICS